jgi:hypothetical protein
MLQRADPMTPLNATPESTLAPLVLIAVISATLLAGCFKDIHECEPGSATIPCNGETPPLYSIGGTVVWLEGTGLKLQNNGSDDLPIGADGSFAFSTKLSNGSTYNVTVQIQPATPTQACTPSNATGTINGGDVTDVQVICENLWGSAILGQSRW